jgi:twitching motility protein PilT
MRRTPAIANLIREGKTHMIYNAIDTGAKFGMQSLDKSLEDLVKAKKINLEDALIKARDQDKVKMVLGMGGGAAPQR